MRSPGRVGAVAGGKALRCADHELRGKSLRSVDHTRPPQKGDIAKTVEALEDHYRKDGEFVSFRG